jgi:hypothetical protein
MRYGLSARTGLTLACLSGLYVGSTSALGGEVVVRFSDSRRAGSVRIFLTDRFETSLSATANIPAMATGAQKRQAIQNAIVAAGLPAGWAVNGMGDRLTITNNNDMSMVAGFYPRNTGERMDYIVVPGNRPTTFPGGHGNIDPHAPQGMSLSNGDGPAVFNAGVVVGGVEYIYTLMGNDPRFGGASSVSELDLTQYLYDGLSSMALPSGVSLTYAGLAGIHVDFDPSIWSLGEYGIIWGTDSLTGDVDDSGFNGSLTAVPAPGSLALLGVGMLLACKRRRGAV